LSIVPRARSETLTEREAQVMDVLWRLGPATAEQVREALPGGPHDSTVRTLLRVLESKGHVARDDRGTAYTFRATVDRARAQRTAARGLLNRFFGGSAEDLVLCLVEDEAITPEQLEEIRQTLQPQRKHRARGDPR
jgi:predicted transcriptional regulator